MRDDGKRNGGWLTGLLGRLAPRRAKPGEIPGVVDPATFNEALTVERSRADRTSEPLSLIVSCQAACAEERDGVALQRLAQVFLERKRCTDIVGWIERGRLGLILPHTSGQDAWRMLQNVRSRLPLRGPESEGREDLCYCVHSYAFDEKPTVERRRLAPREGVSDAQLAQWPSQEGGAWPPDLDTLRACRQYRTAARRKGRARLDVADDSMSLWPPTR